MGIRSADAGSRYLVMLVGVSVLYLGAAKFGLSLAFGTKQVSAVWPPTGIALFAVLVFGYRAWPGIYLGALVANALTAEAFGTAAGIAFGNTLTALVGGLVLVRVFGFDAALGRARDVFALVVVALLSPVISATSGVGTLAASGIVSWPGYWSVWRVWWVGDAMGILIVAPVLLTWTSHWQSRLPRRRQGEAALLFLGLLLATNVGFATGLVALPAQYQLQYVAFPFIIWAALRFDQRVPATAVLLTGGVAVWATIHDRGPFGLGAPDHRLVLVELFLAVLALTALVLAAVTAERSQAQDAIRRHQAQLTAAVADLTTARDQALDTQAALRASEERRESLVAAMLHAEEGVRQRIAVELHDDAIQVMVAALLSLDRCRTALGEDDAYRAGDGIARVRAMLAEAVERVRRLTFELRPPLLEAGGLEPAITDMLDQMSDDLHIAVTTSLNVRRYTPDLEILVFRTVRELLANVRKHANATHLHVTLHDDNTLIHGTVVDNGVGFDTEKALDRRRMRLHLGLDATNERLRLAGGGLTINSDPSGTTARFHAPTRRASDLHTPSPTAKLLRRRRRHPAPR